MPYYYDDDDDGGMLYGQVDDATLQEVEAVVNVDVEMLVSNSYSRSPFCSDAEVTPHSHPP